MPVERRSAKGAVAARRLRSAEPYGSERPGGLGAKRRLLQAANLHDQGVGAFFQNNDLLVEWVNQQSLSNPLICLGDGHQGIWNIFAAISNSEGRREILDWYHLVENLGQVGGSLKRLDLVEALLWKGKVDRAIEKFADWKHEKVSNFIAYLNKHRHRIVNYDYYQSEGISIGSGTIESTIKQIDERPRVVRRRKGMRSSRTKN